VTYEGEEIQTQYHSLLTTQEQLTIAKAEEILQEVKFLIHIEEVSDEGQTLKVVLRLNR